jgi:hypothetical protein
MAADIVEEVLIQIKADLGLPDPASNAISIYDAITDIAVANDENLATTVTGTSPINVAKNGLNYNVSYTGVSEVDGGLGIGVSTVGGVATVSNEGVVEIIPGSGISAVVTGPGQVTVSASGPVTLSAWSEASGTTPNAQTYSLWTPDPGADIAAIIPTGATGGFTANPSVITGNSILGPNAVDLQQYRGAVPGFGATGQYASIGGGLAQIASGTSSTIGGGSTNTASGADSTVGGGLSNQSTATSATVAGGSTNTASGTYSTVAGGFENVSSFPYSVIGGGSGNAASANYSTIGGGIDNAASGADSTIGGGFENIASGGDSTVGGGSINNASGDDSTIAGGQFNTASASNSTVGGGSTNTASGDTSTVAGGFTNTANAQYSSIGGGNTNNATNTGATVGGGQTNTASGTNTTVGGGTNNNVSGSASTVGGGASNIVSGNTSVIGGGFNNQVGQTGSTIAGGSGNVATASTSSGAAIGGGSGNAINGLLSTIAGGSNNTVNVLASNSAIGGGLGNTTNSQYAAIPGGHNQSAIAYGSSTTGGLSLTARSVASSLSGCYGDSNEAYIGGHQSACGTPNDKRLSQVSGATSHGAGTCSADFLSVDGGYGSSVYYEWDESVLQEVVETEDWQYGIPVTVLGEKIIPAKQGDPIVGITCPHRGLVANAQELEWVGKYERSEFGTLRTKVSYVVTAIGHLSQFGDKYKSLMEKLVANDSMALLNDIVMTSDEKDVMRGVPFHPTYVPVLSANYNSEIAYIPRRLRSEWVPVCYSGVARVRADKLDVLQGGYRFSYAPNKKTVLVRL